MCFVFTFKKYKFIHVGVFFDWSTLGIYRFAHFYKKHCTHVYIWWNFMYRIYTCFCSLFQYEENVVTIMFHLAKLYNHYWPWNENGEEVAYKIRDKEGNTWNAPRSKPQKKKKVSLKKLERTQRIRSEWLGRSCMIPKVLKSSGVL